MAVSRRYKKKNKKPNRFRKIIIFLLVLTVAVGGFIFIPKFFEDSKTNLEKTSYPQKYSEYVEKAAKEYSLEPALIYAVIRTESNFDPEAQSSVGACGLMQIMPSSFEWLQQLRGCEGTYTSDDLFTPEICIDYGSYLLKYFYDLYGDEQCAVAAYNAGFVVSDWLENSEYSSDGKTLDNIPYPETSDYVDKVDSAKKMYIKLYYS